MSDASPKPSVVIVGGGFAGVGCAKELAQARRARDAHRPAQLPPVPAAAVPGRHRRARTHRHRPAAAGDLRKDPSVSMRQASRSPGSTPRPARSPPPTARRSPATTSCVAAGTKPNFFNTPGADEHAFPLYSVPTRRSCATALFELFEDAAANRGASTHGALNFVIVGAGPTGVETAGALADLVNEVMPKRFHHLDVKRTRIYLVDHGPVVLARVLRQGPRLRRRASCSTTACTLMLGIGVNEVDTPTGRPQRRHGDPDPLRRLGRRHPGPDARRRHRAAPGPRRPPRRAEPDLTVEGSPTCTPSATSPTSPTTTARCCPSSGRWRCRPGGGRRRTSSPTSTGKPRDALPLQGQGHHGDDRRRRRGRRDGHASPRAARARRVRRVARRARIPDERLSQRSRRVHRRGRWDFIGSSRASSIIDDPDAARIDWGDEEGDDEPLSDAPPAACRREA